MRARATAWVFPLVLLAAMSPKLDAQPPLVPVVDLHVDLSYQFNYQERPFSHGTGQYPAKELVRAGVMGIVLPLYIPKSVDPEGPRLGDLERSYVSVFDAVLRTPPYRLFGCTPQRREIQTWLAFEGSAPLGQRPDEVAVWVARGVRLFGLVHSYDNRLAGSSGANSNLGLTAEGRALVTRIHQLGGVVDVSHASDRASDEVIALAKRQGRPVVATHSNARALAPHRRNLTDSQLLGIAATGGVVGVNFHQPFLASRGKSASLSDVVRQVRYIARLAGIDAVALGSDFEGDIRPVPELGDARAFRRLADALRADGMSEQEIRKAFYKNALRVLCPAP